MTIAAILGGKGREVVSVRPDTRVGDAVATLAERRIGAVPVIEGDAVRGVFSERDVIACLSAEGAAALDKSVSEVMTAPAVTVGPDDAVLGRTVTDDAAADPSSAGGGRGPRDRHRVDRRPGEASHRRDRGGCGGDAGLHPADLRRAAGLTDQVGSGCLRATAHSSRSTSPENSHSQPP